MLTEALSKERVFQLIDPQVLSADHTSAVLKMTQEPNLGSELTICVYLGVPGVTLDASNYIEFVLEGSDDGTNWAALPGAQLVNAASGTIVSAKAAADASQIHEVGVLKSHQEYRVRADFTGTHGTGTPMAAWARVGRLAVSRIVD